MRVEVVYASTVQQRVAGVDIREGATIADAIAAVKAIADFPAMGPGAVRVGIFGKLATPDTVLREGDRVEIYRQLLVDPMQARRRRAEKKSKKS